MAISKLNSPLILKGSKVYPLTSADQIILSNGSRLEENGEININNVANANRANIADAAHSLDWIDNNILMSFCNIPFTHSKSGTVHNLTGDYYNNSMMRFASMEPWNKGDTLKINGKEARCYDSKKGVRCEDKVLFAKYVIVNVPVNYAPDEDVYNVFFNIGDAGPGITVVGGTTQPASPENNTIWVNTNSPITKYEIGSIKNPTWSTSEGWLYIYAITSNYEGLNVFMNHGISDDFYIQPIIAYQYTNGAWVEKPIKWYGTVNKTGTTQWNETAFLYYRGNEASFLTGGWSTIQDSSSITLTKMNTHLDIKNSNGYSSGFYTTSKIDLTNIKTLTVTGQGSYSSNQYNVVELAVGISNSPTLSWGTFEKCAVGKGTSANTTYNLSATLDVSSYSGSYYVVIKTYSMVNGQVYTLTYT